MPLKVCQLCAVDFTLKHFLTALIDGMQAQGWSVTAVCSDGPFVPALRTAGYRIETLPIARGLNPFKHVVSLLRLIRLFRRERFDLLHAHTPIAALLGRIAARVAGVPMVVYTAHGFYFHEGTRALPKALFTWLEWLGGRMTDLLFTQSAEDAHTAIEKNFAPAGRVIAIGNGVDVGRFNPALVEIQGSTRGAIRAGWGIPHDAVVIGMIGRMVAEKGYGEFLDAAKIVVAQGFPVFFIAIGDRLASDHAAGIDSQIAAANSALGRRLILTGMRSDVPQLLAAMDVFTLPSWREGMPRTIIEAMLMAKPVVATNIRGSREEVIAGETGLLTPVRDARALAEAFITLSCDAAMRARMGQAGRARALALYDEAKVVARQINAIRAHLPAALAARE
jgi:glycosyltransferase involved in cell wall biosynthesis